jgi:hypothetical protein
LWHGQRIGDALAVEIDDGVMDGLVERGDVCENLVGEVMALRSRQAGSISLSSGAYFGSHSTVSQCVRAASAASEEISGAASRKSRECRAILRRGKSRLDARTSWWSEMDSNQRYR